MAKSEFERAIALDPTGSEGGYARDDLLAMTALITGRFEDVIARETQNLARSPLDTSLLFFLGWILFYGGHFEEAAAIQHRLLELDPAYLDAHGAAARTSLLMGNNADALAESQRETDEDDRLKNLALVYWAMQRGSESDMALRQLESKFADVDAYDIGEVHAYRGEADTAFT